MHALRASILGNRRIAILIVALALAMKALLPAGYMVSTVQHAVAITVCNGVTGGSTPATIEIAAKGGDHGGKAAHDGADQPCAYAGLAMTATGGADPILLAGALLFILALGFAPLRQTLTEPLRHILPPLRGPPATA